MNEIVSYRKEGAFITNWFRFVPPTEPIEKDGFIGATWGDVDPSPIKSLRVRDHNQNVKIFGFQRLCGNNERGGSIAMHPEKDTELTYPIVGRMDMTIRSPGEHEVVSHMEGVVPLYFIDQLQNATYCIREDGALVINARGFDEREPGDSDEYIVFPTVTPAGSSHGTVQVSGACIYLAVKVGK